MRNKILLAILLAAAIALSQPNPFISGSIGYLNNAAVGFRGGVISGHFKMELGASFSSVVPFQHHVSVGYIFGNNWQVTPLVGAIHLHYGSDKEKNGIKPAAGIEIAKQINLDGTNGAYLLDGAAVYAEYFGRFAGIGLRIVF